MLTTESAHLSFDPQGEPKELHPVNSDSLEIQSDPKDADLCLAVQTQHQLPRLSLPYTNKGTVRIYAHSLHLKNTPLLKSSVLPSVITVERAALCQIFLETKYHKTFQQPSERDLRRQTLESLVSK